MSVSPGFTAEEIRGFVFEYELLRYGRKTPWLAENGITRHQMRRWKMVTFAGDLERGLVPRDGWSMTLPPDQRRALEQARTAEREAHATELERLQRRVGELEATNDALGKAIGLLHERNAPEPAATPPTTDPSSSSTPSTPSSPS